MTKLKTRPGLSLTLLGLALLMTAACGRDEAPVDLQRVTLALGCADGTDQSQETSGAQAFIVSGRLYAQTFTPTADASLTQVDLLFYQHLGNASESVTIHVTPLSAAQPDTGSALASVTLTAGQIATSSGSWLSVTIDPPAALAAGAGYAVVVETAAAQGADYAWQGADSDAYAGGAALVSSDAGASWSAPQAPPMPPGQTAVTDFAFRTIVSCSSSLDCDVDGDGACGQIDATCEEAACQSGTATDECDDEDPCTEGDMCIAGACAGQPVGPAHCDDDDPCTDDACDPVTGCAYTNNEAPCQDDDPCTLTACQDGACAVTGFIEGCCHQHADCAQPAEMCHLADHACVPVGCVICVDRAGGACSGQPFETPSLARLLRDTEGSTTTRLFVKTRSRMRLDGGVHGRNRAQFATTRGRPSDPNRRASSGSDHYSEPDPSAASRKRATPSWYSG